MFLGLNNVKNITIFLKKHIEITYRKAEIIRFMCSVSLNSELLIYVYLKLL